MYKRQDDAQTYFALPHFRTGALKVEDSGEPLRGPIGRGLLLSCLFQAEQYGARLICQLLEPAATFRMREHRWDINMWGTHQSLGRSELQEDVYKRQEMHCPDFAISVKRREEKC